MMKLEEIVEHVDRRLEELREESTRLRAALEALRDNASTNRRPHAGGTATPAVNTFGHGDPVKPSSGYAARLTQPNAVSGDHATKDPPVERAIAQLRQELAAGLRR